MQNTMPDRVSAEADANKAAMAAFAAFNPAETKQRVRELGSRRIARLEFAIQDEFKLPNSYVLLSGLLESASQKIMLLFEINPSTETSVQILSFHSSTINQTIPHNGKFHSIITDARNQSRVAVYIRPSEATASDGDVDLGAAPAALIM